MEKEHVKPRVLAVRSWIGRLFPYVRLLEALVHDQAEYIAVLQERHERVITGYGLTEPMPNMVDLTEMQTEAMAKPRNIVELQAQMEEASKKKRDEYEREQAEAYRKSKAGKVNFAEEISAAGVKPNGKGDVRNADK
jgi:hypothetical protein